MLAEAAVRLYINYCGKAIDRWESCSPESVDTVELHRECRRFGVKTGMPLDRDSLIKTILRVDETEWARAYDYENGAARREKLVFVVLDPPVLFAAGQLTEFFLRCQVKVQQVENPRHQVAVMKTAAAGNGRDLFRRTVGREGRFALFDRSPLPLLEFQNPFQKVDAAVMHVGQTPITPQQ